MSRHHLRLPRHVAELDGPPERAGLDLQAHLHEICQVFHGQVGDREANLGLGSHQLLTGQPVECLAHHVEADLVPCRQVRDLKPLTRPEPSGQDRTTNLLVYVTAQSASVARYSHDPHSSRSNTNPRLRGRAGKSWIISCIVVVIPVT